MNNNKLSTGIEEIDKELSKGSSLEEFVKFHLGSELQPYQKQIVNIIESNENISTEEFAKQYNLNLRKRSNRINILSTPLNNDSSGYAYHFLKAQFFSNEIKKSFEVLFSYSFFSFCNSSWSCHLFSCTSFL